MTSLIVGTFRSGHFPAYFATSLSGSTRSFQTVSVADQLAAAGGRPAGFDYMRLGLSIGVVGQHSHAVCYGMDAVTTLFRDGSLRALFGLILPMFFALSGFLVAGSLERCRTLISFLSLRVLRIVPALAVEITLSALILGPIFTSLELTTYFTIPGFSPIFQTSSGWSSSRCLVFSSTIQWMP